MIPPTIRLTSTLGLALALAACDSSSGPDTQGGLVHLSIATSGAPGASGPLLAGAPVEFTDGTNTLVIDKIEMVVKEVELEQSESSASCGEDDCDENEVEVGPFLLDLPLSAGATTVITLDVTPGTYDEFEFKIHKPEDDDSNSAFLAAHPDFEGISIRVTGTWNGVPFTYTTDLSAEQETDLVPPLVVAEVGSADFTLFIDIATWFRRGDGMLIDPSTANEDGANEDVVENNIEQSFESFEDEDHDGCDDHDDDDDGGEG